jgi:hypothetical protein
MTSDTIDYTEYDERFQRLVGDIQPGQYGRYRGRLVRRLTPSEYADQKSEYVRLGERLTHAVNAGETLSDNLTAELRSTEVNLVLERSSYLP